jgi:hypothetical protein
MNAFRNLLYNLGTFLLAVILAGVIWAAAVLNNDPVETRLWQIDVQTIGLPPDAQLLSRPPNTASITIEGPLSALDNLSPEDYTAVIDLSEVAFGESDVEIQVQGEYERVRVLNKSRIARLRGSSRRGSRAPRARARRAFAPARSQHRLSDRPPATCPPGIAFSGPSR